MMILDKVKKLATNNNLIVLGAGVVIGLIAMFFLKSKEIVEVDVPIRIEVPVPVVEVQFDTIYNVRPIRVPGEKVIDSLYYKEYLELKDQIAKDSLFREAITINEYREKIEDDTIVINLYAKTRGTLEEYQIGYKTKPRTIPLDTTIRIAIPRYAEFYGGADLFLPYGDSPQKPSVIPGILYIPKKHKSAWKLGVDPINQGVQVGWYKRF